MRKHILDIPVDWLSPEALERKLKHFVMSREPHQITTVNPEFIVISQENEPFKEALLAADLSIADGTGLVLAQTLSEKQHRKSKLIRLTQFLALGVQFVLAPHAFNYKRITGVELSYKLMELSAENGWRVFLLGGMPGVAQKAGEIWTTMYPGLNIVGASGANPQDEGIIKEIRAAKPDVLLVAYGAPKQDLFIFNNKQQLKTPIMVGVGGTFDYVTGNMLLAPTWVRAIGMEWLVRLAQQPKRFRRIWRSTFDFTKLIIDAKNQKD